MTRLVPFIVVLQIAETTRHRKLDVSAFVSTICPSELATVKSSVDRKAVHVDRHAHPVENLRVLVCDLCYALLVEPKKTIVGRDG